MKILSMILPAFVFSIASNLPVTGQTYKQAVQIMKDIVENGNYHTDVRPLKDQSKSTEIFVSFELVSIVGVNDVAQSFTANGFLFFEWFDEILVWDPSQYGNRTRIYPVPKNIWIPRVIVINTLGDRDLFKDDVAPLFVNKAGWVNRAPGGLFPTSCELQLTDYPFDVQTCSIQLISMNYGTDELVFKASLDKIYMEFFVKHSAWELIDSKVNGTVLVTEDWQGPSVQIIFVLKRRPTFLLVNIVLPVVFLSFLNILVFVIPADSGEKISYGITVLLALSVFLSIVSGMLPRTGTETPKLTIYLFMLLIISMLTVIDSIIIVYLANKDEQETAHRRANNNFKNAFSKIRTLRRTISTMFNYRVEGGNNNRSNKLPSFVDSLKQRSEPCVTVTDDANDAKGKKESSRVNKYRLIGKHIDSVSLVVFLIPWLVITLGFLFDMAF